MAIKKDRVEPYLTGSGNRAELSECCRLQGIHQKRMLPLFTGLPPTTLADDRPLASTAELFVRSFSVTDAANAAHRQFLLDSSG